jgi:hypothetical protein
MSQPRFRTKKGQLSLAALACGYVDRHIQENNGKFKLLWMEHQHFHVMSGVTGQKYETWEVFDDLNSARIYFNKIKISHAKKHFKRTK